MSKICPVSASLTIKYMDPSQSTRQSIKELGSSGGKANLSAGNVDLSMFLVFFSEKKTKYNGD